MNECEELIEKGYTREAAEELCKTAKAIGIKPSKLISAARKLEKEGIALTPADWAVVKKVMDKGFPLSAIINYIIKRHRSGLTPSQIIEELPIAARNSAKKGRLLSRLTKALEAPEYFVVEDRGVKRSLSELFKRE